MSGGWAAVVLAAGLSRRFGTANKLLAPIAGVPMLHRVIALAQAAGFANPHVVLGHDAEEIARGLVGRGGLIVINPDFESGMASSLHAGLSALPDEVEGALILLGDMPLVRAETVATLVAAAAAHPERAAFVPVEGGEWGNPVLIRRRLFPEVLALTGDRGARALLRGRADCLDVAVDDPGIHRDFDTPEMLRAALSTAPSS